MVAPKRVMRVRRVDVPGPAAAPGAGLSLGKPPSDVYGQRAARRSGQGEGAWLIG